MTKDRILKVLKLLALTASENEHEALSAVRAANRMLQADNMTWETFFVVSNTRPRESELEQMMRRAREAQAQSVQMDHESIFEAINRQFRGRGAKF